MIYELKIHRSQLESEVQRLNEQGFTINSTKIDHDKENITLIFRRSVKLEIIPEAIPDKKEVVVDKEKKCFPCKLIESVFKKKKDKPQPNNQLITTN